MVQLCISFRHKAVAFTLLLSMTASAAIIRKDDIPTSTADPTGTTIPTTAPREFKHPGVFVSGPQLDFIAGKVQSNAQPWSDALAAMLADPLASPTRTAHPYATVECGPTSTPNIGCYDEREDSMAAYMNALAWWITKNKQYAEKAISYMNAWSSTIKAHTNSNAPLQSAWSAANWVRAGEIIRHGEDSGWAHENVEDFENMLTNVYIPLIYNGSTNNGNWELVFLSNTTIYSHALALLSARLPAYIYLTSDGPLPLPGAGIASDGAHIVKYWNGQRYFNVSGITQETCRDFAHTSYGISSISHVAETARIQGLDLWTTSLGTRVRLALELHAPWQTGGTVPGWICGGVVPRSMDPIVEPPYNALAYRLGKPMPNTEKLVLQQRPAAIGEPVPLFIGWETLTNADNPIGDDGHGHQVGCMIGGKTYDSC